MVASITQDGAAVAGETSRVAIDGPRLMGKIAWRLIPFLCVLFVVNYLDRTNIAMAKLRMMKDTGLDDEMFGLGAGLFFIGYFVFEVPSNLILERVGARRWIARIMITWGIISGAFMFVRGPWSFYALRFLLGVAEAGFFPGIVLYLTYWVPERRRANALAAFLTSTAVSGIVGLPLAGALMKLEGIHKLHGWQWLFLVEGIIPVLLGVVTWILLPDRPEQAHWLDERERTWLADELAKDHAAVAHHTMAELAHALADARLWKLSALYFMLIMGLYSFVYWVPSIVESVTPGASVMRIGLLSAIPSVVAAVSMVIIGEHSDRQRERRWHVAGCAVVSAIGISGVIFCHSTPSMIVVLCVAAVGIFGALGPFWALATKLLRGSAAAGGIAIVNSIGALAGFVAPYVLGWAKQSSGSFARGLLIVSASLLCAVVTVLTFGRGDAGAGEGSQ
jgi:ACS family tartrate transporter-like MFS transporter